MDNKYEKRGYLLDDFRLFHLCSEGVEAVEAHYHDFHKLTVIFSGSGVYTVEGRRYLMQPGDVVLVGRGSIHRPEIGRSGVYERAILYISDAYLKEHGVNGWDLSELFGNTESHVLRLNSEEQRLIQRAVCALERELNGESPDAVLMSRCLFTEMLLMLYRVQRGGIQTQTPPSEPGDEKVLAILRYLNDHLTEDISIDRLSEKFYISKYHMMRRFRQETGMPIHAYLNDKRLFLARDLIARGTSATEACYQSGFQSYSAFSRAYQKRFRVTPTGRVSAYTEDICD